MSVACRFPFVTLLAVASLLASGCEMGQTRLENSPVLISELHFHPSDAQGEAEFIEVANIGATDVDLANWSVSGAGRVSFAAGTSLAPGEALVLAGDVAAMQAAFGASITVHEVLSGKLSNQGEQVRIEDPQGRLADEVGFDPTFPEVGRADGTGLSIHRGFAPSVGPTGSWRAAEPTPGRFEPAALSRVAP